MPNFISILTTLEHLSYIIECVAKNCTGEAKSELNQLIENVSNLNESAIGDKSFVEDNLKEAMPLLRDSNKRHAVPCLTRVSRCLWKYII